MLVTGVRRLSLAGQTPPSGNLQVSHDSWTFKDGAPPDVNCLAQTNDGFLWLCSPNGLLRFDGTRFEPFRSQFGEQLLSTKVYSLFAPRSGGLWVGYTLGGFSLLDNGRVTNYASETGSVLNFAEDRDGIVWSGTSSGLWRFDHSAWQHIGAEWNVPDAPARQVGFDSQGILWALVGGGGAPTDLIYLMPGLRRFKVARRNLSVEGFTWNADRAVVTDPTASSMSDFGGRPEERPPVYPVVTKTQQFVDRTGSLWISPAGKPVVMRLPRENLQDAFNKVAPAGSETYDINPFENAWLVDHEGNIWFGDTTGIHRFFYTPFVRQEFPKEESADFAVVADDNGAVWISSGGRDGPKADLYYVVAGKAERRVPEVTTSFAYRAPDKTFWFSGVGCLWHLVGGDFVRVDLPHEVVNQFNFLQTITGDKHGGVWVSFGRHGLYRLADGIWTSYGGRDDLPKGSMLVEFTDSSSRVWFGYMKNQLAVLDGNSVRVFGPIDGLQVGNILAIYGRGSEIWIGGELGLEQFDHGHFRRIAAVDDELLRGISGIVESPDGDLWLNGISGIFHIRKAQISQALKDSTFRVTGEHFGRREGLPGVAAQLRPLPTATEGTDGRLWFTLRNGVVWLDPATYTKKQAMPAPIKIESISADDKDYSLGPRLSLPAHTSSVQISYSAVSLSDPEAIRFRYKLQGTDNDWHEVAAARPVNYRNLPPGAYQFNVSASDTNGAWSDKVATVEFTILPAFHQTLWFRSLCLIALLAMLAGLYQLRLRQLARQYDTRLEGRVGERTRIARELHDTLLQSFHGLLLQLQTAYKLLPERPAEAQQALGTVIEDAFEAITEGRDAIQGLRTPTVCADLAVAIKSLGEDLSAQGSQESSVLLRVNVAGTPQTLRPLVRDEVYRIAGESLGNAFRHAQATQIEVDLYYDDRQLRLRVRDNGKGIDPQFLREEGRAGHYGIQGMRERAKLTGGHLTVWSAPHSGTEVDLSIPASRVYAAPQVSQRRSLLRRLFPARTPIES